jgi:hypothetical protein
MAKRKFIPLKSSDAIAKRLESGAAVAMSDGWRGRVHYDDGKTVSLVQDGEQMNSAFRGCRGFVRRSMKIGCVNLIGRSQVVDLAARKLLPAVDIVDRALLEAEWEASKPWGY